MLMNPGGATATWPNPGGSSRTAASCSAIASGARRSGLASFSGSVIE
jgi:hypothetical protein